MYIFAYNYSFVCWSPKTTMLLNENVRSVLQNIYHAPQEALRYSHAVSCCGNVAHIAGHDTTASAISWTLYALAKHEEYQQKAQDEIDQILQSRDRDDIEW